MNSKLVPVHGVGGEQGREEGGTVGWEGGEQTDRRMGQTRVKGRDGEADWEVSQGKQAVWSLDGQRER